MNDIDIYKELIKALEKVSGETQKAIDLFDKHPLDKGKELEAMSLIICCDIVRLAVAFEEHKFTNIYIHRILWMVGIESKLYAAKEWHNKVGGKLLLNVSTDKKKATKKIKDIKKKYSINTENKEFKEYRDKIGSHYDKNALHHLKKFKNQEKDFNKSVLNFLDFSCEWVKLVKSNNL